MRILLILIAGFTWLFGFELVLNTGREGQENFAVLHAKNDQEFSCKEVLENTKVHFECEVLGVVDNALKDRNFEAFDLKFIKEEQKIRIIIVPKIQARMFDLSQNIYEDEELKGSGAKKSKSFTFIFMKNFSKNGNQDGLNFNVDFPHQILPYVGALDLNSNPVIVPQSADINTYLRIKDEYEKGNYPQVAIDSQNAIERYRNSIFMSEFILYKLRAQDKIYNNNPEIRDQQALEKMVEETKNWTRTFTSDKHFPEVLHILLRTYMSLAQRADVDYTMSILENEQTNSYFAELSKLDFADYIYELGEKERAVKIYEEVYYNTHNVSLAAKAAMSLARDLLLKGDLEGSRTYVEKIFSASPSYFGEDLTRSLELAKLLYQRDEFDLSAKIYENAFNKMPTIDPRHEETLKDLTLTLSKSSKPIEAKKYLDLYHDEYVDGKYLDIIASINDRIFFVLGENNAIYLHQRYKDLAKQYENNDKNLAKKALEEDVKLYFNEGNLSAVLAYKDKIEALDLSEAKKLLEQAAITSLLNDLKADHCIEATQTFKRFSAYDLGQKIAIKKKMLECLQRTSNIEEALIYADKNIDEDRVFYSLQKAEIYFANKQYNQAIKLAKEIANSRVLKSDDEEFRAFYLQFVSLLRLNEYNQAIKILQILERYPMNFTMVEAYDALISFAKDNQMQTTILTYAPKAIDFQNFKGINLFSPSLEFVYLENLQNTAQHEKALEVLVDLLKIKKLTSEERARAFYLQSLSYEALKDLNAQKESLNQCLALKEGSNWQDLCRSKLQLLGN